MPTSDSLQTLRTALEGFDGNAVSYLSELQHSLKDTPGFLDDAIALLADEAPLIQRGTSWLIRYAEPALSEPDIANVSHHLSGITDWQAALHLLQLAALSDTLPPPDSWATFARTYLGHKRPFLRAWSIAALCKVATTTPELRAEAESARQSALNDPAASVRARARNIVPLDSA